MAPVLSDAGAEHFLQQRRRKALHGETFFQTQVFMFLTDLCPAGRGHDPTPRNAGPGNSIDQAELWAKK